MLSFEKLTSGHAASAHAGASCELYLEEETAVTQILLPPPFVGRKYHLFCSKCNAGALALAKELGESNVFVTKGKKVSSPLYFTSDPDKLAQCDHMLVLLDERTWTSGADTGKFVEHVHMAMRVGVHIFCVHEFPSVVGPPRHACDFALMFHDDWTPAHLTGGRANLYKEIDLALKGEEWRQPGLVALADKLATSAGVHNPIDVTAPPTYQPKTGANPWLAIGPHSLRSQALPGSAANESSRSESGVEMTAVPMRLTQCDGRSAEPLPRPRPSVIRRTLTELAEETDELEAGGAEPDPRAVRRPFQLVRRPSRERGRRSSKEPVRRPSKNPLRRPSKERRRSEDAGDEMRMFNSRGDADQPPTQRRGSRNASARGTPKTASAADTESDILSSRSLECSDRSLESSDRSFEGPVCAGSPAEESSASCPEMSSSSSAPGASEPGGRASVFGRARAASLAEEADAVWVAIRSSFSGASEPEEPGASEPGAAQASETLPARRQSCRRLGRDVAATPNLNA